MTPESIREKGDEFIGKFSTLNDAIKAVEEIIKALPSISCEYEIENVYKPILNYLKSKQ